MTTIEVLRKYQKQLDPEGIEVGVSRQALDEVLDTIESLQAENKRLDAALERIETNRRTENPWTFPFETPEDFEEYARKARGQENE